MKKIVQELILPSVSDAVKNHFMPPYKGVGVGGEYTNKICTSPVKAVEWWQINKTQLLALTITWVKVLIVTKQFHFFLR